MATGDRGVVAFDDEVELETKNKEEKGAIGGPVEKDENRMGILKEASQQKSSPAKEENRRKSSDFWLLWPQPSTRASMARFALLLLPQSVRNRQIFFNMTMSCKVRH